MPMIVITLEGQTYSVKLSTDEDALQAGMLALWILQHIDGADEADYAILIPGAGE